MEQAVQKSFLAICSRSPGRGSAAREGLDMLLATASFGQQVQLLFCGDGVYQLLSGQGDAGGNNKPLSASLDALPLYDIDQLYVEVESLVERGLEAQALMDNVTVLDSAAAAVLLHNCDKVISL